MPPKSKDSKLAEAVQEAAGQPLNQDLLLILVGYNCRPTYLNNLPPFNARKE